MSQPRVLERGDEFLSQYPRDTKSWQFFSKTTMYFTVFVSKTFLNIFYKPRLNGLENLDVAMTKAEKENRGIITVMNHMSVVDDPFVWGTLPFSFYIKHGNNFRWCLAASNLCFATPTLAKFFSLGQTLSTERFGKGPFQGSIDAAIRLLSPDDTLDLEFSPDRNNNQNESTKLGSEQKNLLKVLKPGEKASGLYKPPLIREKPSWIHVYPEGFVLQLEPPFNNSMRYFKWGITRLILESTEAPVVVPMFATGFEKIAPETDAGSKLGRYLPKEFGSEINVTIGKQISEEIINGFRQEWQNICDKYLDNNSSGDLNYNLKFSKEAEQLRSDVAASLREHVALIRHEIRKFPQEDPRFKSPSWWKRYTKTEGESDKDVKFIGQNWAIRRLQGFSDDDNLEDLANIEEH
ncbi:hypothetical protein ACO0SA_001751 [Hanseniaspora valbyensis]